MMSSSSSSCRQQTSYFPTLPSTKQPTEGIGGTPEAKRASFTPAQKIENVLYIGDGNLLAAQYLENELLAALDPSLDAELTKTKRTQLCGGVTAMINLLRNFHDLAYASGPGRGRPFQSRGLSSAKQGRKAHKKSKREEKIRWKEMQRRTKPNEKQKQSESIAKMVEMSNNVTGRLRPESISEVSADVVDNSPSTSMQTRSDTSQPEWMKRLPELERGCYEYSPKQVIDFVVAENEKIDAARKAGKKGVMAMRSELKLMKQYLVDNDLVPCGRTNIDRIVKDFTRAEVKVYPPAWGMDGPRPKVELDELYNVLAERARESKCRKFSIDAVRDCILTHARKTDPNVSLEKLGVTPQTLQTYKTALENRCFKQGDILT